MILLNHGFYIIHEKKNTRNRDYFILLRKFISMKKYKCKVCGYLYDPEMGDPDGGVAPGTPFEEIPFDWSCPVCGVTKDDFEEFV